MAAIVPFFEEVLTLKERREEGPTGASEALGVARGAPAPSTLHVSLEKLVQGRQIIEKWLLVNQVQILVAPKKVHPPKLKRPKMPDLSFGKYRSDGKPLAADRSPQPWFLWTGRMEGTSWTPIPIPANLVFWAPMPIDNHAFALWSESNGKMACPTWDLPAGSNLLGGSCPGATPGQSVVPGRDRANYAAADGSGLVRLRFGAPPNRDRLPTLPIVLQETICERCLAGDTRVVVRGEGLVPIRELVGREVEVWSGQAWRRTTAKLMREGAETVEVRASWGQRLRATPDHKFLTDEGMVEACELEADSVLMVQFPEEAAFPEAASIPNLPAHLGSCYSRSAAEDRFPREWSREVGLLLGYVLGDGNVYYHPRYPAVSICSSAQDVADLKVLQDAVATWTGSEAEVHERAAEPNRISDAQPQPMHQISWRMRGLFEFVEACGLDKRPEPAERRTPAGIWTASREAVIGFLQGMFSTDGSVLVGKNKTEVTLASVSHGLLRDVQQLLFAFGIKSNICEYATSNKLRVAVGYSPIYKLNIGSRTHVLRFQELVGFHNARKRQRLAEAIKAWPVGYKYQNKQPRVLSVTPSGVREDVYDLINVGDEHQFSANGLTVSNCYATANNYQMANNLTAMTLRYWWARQCLRQGQAELFIDSVVRSLAVMRFDARDFKHWGIKPVRIHSSGDFFSLEYLSAWVEVANRVAAIDPTVVFWAPTRIWANGQNNEAASRLGALRQPNLVIRASAYSVGDPSPGPLGGMRPGIDPGAAQGSTSCYERHPKLTPGEMARAKGSVPRANGRGDARFDFDCSVYESDEPSCVAASRNPNDKKRGCRACWLNPELSINYTTH